MKGQIQRVDISAAPGMPSTMWKNTASGRTYRKLRQAVNDEGQEVNPDDYEIRTPRFKKFWNEYGKTILIAAIVSIAVLYGYKNFVNK